MYYDKKGKKITLLDWTKLFEDKKYRILKQTVLKNGKLISTIWLGLNHAFGEQTAPLIFETMVFHKRKKGRLSMGELDGERYSTEQEALKGHDRLCEWWKKEKTE